MKHLSKVKISKSALLHNLEQLKSLAQGREVAAVVKGNAYGHGLEQVVQALDGSVDAFQVDDVEELAELRNFSKTRTLILGYVPRHSVEVAIRLGGELAVYDLERLETIHNAGHKLGVRPKIHLKIDALLGRQGLLPTSIHQFLSELSKFPLIELTSVYSHFANIEDTTDLTHAEAQSATFRKCVAEHFSDHNLELHESATSGLMAVEGSGDKNTLVRLGIGLYGLYPSVALESSHADLQLRPVMRWVSHLAQVKVLPANHPVGYGLTFVTQGETRIGIVPQGYSDGYDRGLSNIGEVLVRGKRCRVLGRVAMNMFAVDLSRVPEACPEDEVVLIGDQLEDRITAEELASKIDTINYEVVTRVSTLLPRSVSR